MNTLNVVVVLSALVWQDEVGNVFVKKGWFLCHNTRSSFATADAKADALQRIEQWREQVKDSGVTCFASFLKLLDNWQDRITNLEQRSGDCTNVSLS